MDRKARLTQLRRQEAVEFSAPRVNQANESGYASVSLVIRLKRLKGAADFCNGGCLRAQVPYDLPLAAAEAQLENLLCCSPQFPRYKALTRQRSQVFRTQVQLRENRSAGRKIHGSGVFGKQVFRELFNFAQLVDEREHLRENLVGPCGRKGGDALAEEIGHELAAGRRLG